jgi:hypothetical protein
MVETKARVVAVDFLKMSRPLDVEGIDGVITVLMPGLDEEK